LLHFLLCAHTRLSGEATTDLAHRFFVFASQRGKVEPFGQAVEINDFAATLPEDHPHHYIAPSGRADKRGARWRATTSMRGELVGTLKNGGPAHDPAFTIRRVALGTYELATPERAIVVNKNTAKMSSLAKHLQKESERLLRSVDFTLPALANITPADLRRILQPMDLVRMQLETMEKYGRQVLAEATEQVKRLTLGSGVYVFGPNNPQAHIHASFRKPTLPIASGPHHIKDAWDPGSAASAKPQQGSHIDSMPTQRYAAIQQRLRKRSKADMIGSAGVAPKRLDPA
jgi:hypothetical protein